MSRLSKHRRDFSNDGDRVTANGLQISFSTKEIRYNGEVNAIRGNGVPL